MRWIAKRARKSTIIKKSTSRAEHITVQHLMNLFARFQNIYIELREWNGEYEAHVSDEALEAEYFHIIEFENNVIFRTSTLKCAIDCLRKKESTGPTKTNDSELHELSTMTKLAIQECKQNLSLHSPADCQNTEEKRDAAL